MVKHICPCISAFDQIRHVMHSATMTTSCNCKGIGHSATLPDLVHIANPQLTIGHVTTTVVGNTSHLWMNCKLTKPKNHPFTAIQVTWCLLCTCVYIGMPDQSLHQCKHVCTNITGDTAGHCCVRLVCNFNQMLPSYSIHCRCRGISQLQVCSLGPHICHCWSLARASYLFSVRANLSG